MKADDICNILAKRFHGNTGGSQDWITVQEFRLGSGSTGLRRIDLWAIHTNPSQGNKAITL